MAHPGWGETLPLRTIFPNARILVYCEFYLWTRGRDVGFDPEFAQTGADGHVALHLKNAVDSARSRRKRLRHIADRLAALDISARIPAQDPVIHEGVDVDRIKPHPNADAAPRLRARAAALGRSGDVRRAKPRASARLSRVYARTAADDGGAAERAFSGDRRRRRLLWRGAAGRGDLEIPVPLRSAEQIDNERLHFTGSLPYRDYLAALQISSAHIYLTYPFVLSWSLIEALSAGCLVIGSDTAPVREVIDGENGVLTPFFDSRALADRVIEALEHPAAVHRACGPRAPDRARPVRPRTSLPARDDRVHSRGRGREPALAVEATRPMAARICPFVARHPAADRGAAMTVS